MRDNLWKTAMIIAGISLCSVCTPGVTALAAQDMVSAVSLSSVYKAYLNILQQYQAQIEAYNWQTNPSTYGFADSTTAETALRHVAFTDLNGDDIPEMLFIAAMNADLTADEYSDYLSTLFVYTYADGDTKKILTLDYMDVQAGGGSYYCLFQSGDTDNLYVFTSTGDENWTYAITGYALQDDEMHQASDLRETMVFSYQESSNAYDPVYSYSSDEAPVSHEEYLSQKTSLCGSMKNLIMFNYIEDDDDILRNAVRGMTPSAMTYDDAVAFAQEQTGRTDDADNAVSMVTSSGQVVTADGTTDGFLFPNSDSNLITDADISTFDKDKIQQAINEVYARHGYIFKDNTILAFYQQFSWYNPTVSDMGSVYGLMNSTEQANVSFLSGRL